MTTCLHYHYCKHCDKCATPCDNYITLDTWKEIVKIVTTCRDSSAKFNIKIHLKNGEVYWERRKSLHFALCVCDIESWREGNYTVLKVTKCKP